MKKTLFTLAACSTFCTFSNAQSSVVLYGIVDAFVGKITTTNRVGAAAETKLSQNVVNGSGMSSSRWGMRGKEDLGGGLSAVFVLEGGYDLSTGASANLTPQGTSLFSRQALVGLNGGFGSLSLGRQYTAYYNLRSATNNIYNTNLFATTNTVWGVGVQDYQSLPSNSVAYMSKSYSGFSGGLSYAFGENKTATAPAEKNASILLRYASGPLLVGVAHQREKQVAGGNFYGTSTGGVAPPVTVGETRKYSVVAASYDFGVLSITGGYNIAKSETRKDKEFQAGVVVPFGAAALAAGYSRTESRGAGIRDLEGTGISLLGTYALSKRTNLYAGVINVKRQTGATAAVTNNKMQTYALGLRQTF